MSQRMTQVVIQPPCNIARVTYLLTSEKPMTGKIVVNPRGRQVEEARLIYCDQVLSRLLLNVKEDESDLCFFHSAKSSSEGKLIPSEIFISANLGLHVLLILNQTEKSSVIPEVKFVGREFEDDKYREKLVISASTGLANGMYQEYGNTGWIFDSFLPLEKIKSMCPNISWEEVE